MDGGTKMKFSKLKVFQCFTLCDLLLAFIAVALGIIILLMASFLVTLDGCQLIEQVNTVFVSVKDKLVMAVSFVTGIALGIIVGLTIGEKINE